jgi:hypothetical protein
MPFFMRTASRGGFTLLLLISSLLLGGCASNDRPGRPGRGGQPEAMPTLTGRQSFFHGRIVADVRIGAMSGFDRSGDGQADGSRRRQRREGPGGGDGRGEGSGSPRMRPDYDGASRQPGSRPPMGGGSPPVAIHLRFTNTGTTAAELQVIDFLSPLGNFVVHPASLTIEPGQSVEVEPMASRLAGEAAAGEITLSLRLDGAKETKTVAVQPAPENKAGDRP